MEHQRVPRNTVTKRDEHWCTSGMQNNSVYPKSTRNEAHFPFFGSIAIPCSTEYSTSGLTSLRKLPRFSETPASSLYEYSFQHSTSKKVPCTTYSLKMRADSLSLTEEVSQISTSTSSGVLPQQYVGERDSVLSVSSGIYRERHDSKEGGISLQWLKFRFVFHVTKWRDVWIPCGDPRESHSSLRHLYRANHITMTPQEAHWIQSFKRWRCLTLLENL